MQFCTFYETHREYIPLKFRITQLLDSLLNEDDEVRDIPKEQEVIQRVPDEAYFGSKEYTKNFYGSHVTAEEQKEYLPLRRKVGQATLVRDQVSIHLLYS